MKSHPVFDTLNHDGRAFKPGDRIDLDADRAAPLIALGVIGNGDALPADDGTKGQTKPEKTGGKAA